MPIPPYTSSMNESRDTKIDFHVIAPFLHREKKSTSRILGYIGLGFGVFLLLCCVQMYVNIHFLLREKNVSKNGFDFISITKTITNENAASDNRFTSEEIYQIRQQRFITDAAPLVSNLFRVKASAGSALPFSTDLFLESIDENFLDTLPPNFTWKEGQQDIPIIFSADFLEMYNVFAPAQDLPRLSSATLSSINIILECYGPLGIQSFRGHVVAISDRINSVLVPPDFLQWANKNYALATNVPAARVFLKTKDANNPQLIKYIQANNFRVNSDKTKLGRVRQMLDLVISGLAGFAILVIIMALVLFSFFLQLMIARSRENLQLLITLGYSPKRLSDSVSRKWIPVYSIIIGIALLATSILQYAFKNGVMKERSDLSPWLDVRTWGIGAVLLCLCIYMTQRLVKKQVYHL